jgi:hypothetical protein
MSGFHVVYRKEKMQYTDTAKYVFDVSYEMSLNVFNFCVRTYNHKISPTINPVVYNTKEFIVTWIDPGHWSPSEQF